MSHLKFGDENSIREADAARMPLQKMKASFGPAPAGTSCGECVFFHESVVQEHIEHRCLLYERTHNRVRFWPKKSQGCGKWEAK